MGWRDAVKKQTLLYRKRAGRVILPRAQQSTNPTVKYFPSKADMPNIFFGHWRKGSIFKNLRSFVFIKSPTLVHDLDACVHSSKYVRQWTFLPQTTLTQMFLLFKMKCLLTLRWIQGVSLQIKQKRFEKKTEGKRVWRVPGDLRRCEAGSVTPIRKQVQSASPVDRTLALHWSHWLDHEGRFGFKYQPR